MLVLAVLFVLTSIEAFAGAACVNAVCSQVPALGLTKTTAGRLTEIENYAKHSGIDWSFELDGCDSRAQLLAIGLKQDLNLKAGIVTATDSISIAARFIPWNPDITWGHHTAAFIQVDDNYYVLDFALSDHALKLDDWVKRLSSPYLTTTPPLTLSTLNEFTDTDFEAFAILKNSAPYLPRFSVTASRNILRPLATELLSFEFTKRHYEDRNTFFGEAFQLSSIFKSTESAVQTLSQSTRCLESQITGLNLCTTYIKIENQTCYFQFQGRPGEPAPSSRTPDLTRDLLCF